jgi:hypothetical protein
VRDWLMLVASVLIFIHFGREFCTQNLRHR